MSQQQQQTNGNGVAMNGMNAVNGANNSVIGLLGNSSSWNALVKQNQSDNEDEDSIMNQNGGGSVVVTGLNANSANPTYSTLANHYQQHHTIVPAQIQVQVQIQVPILSASSQQQQQPQQTIDTSSVNNPIQASQSRLYLLSPSATVQNPSSLTNASYAILEA